MTTRFKLVLLALLALSAFIPLYGEDDTIALEQDSSDPKLAKIVLIAGNQAGNILHQYWAGTVLISKLLRQTPGIHVVVVRGGWPKNPAIFDNAKAIVLYMEGGEDGTVHPLSVPGRMDVLQKAIEAGAGLVTLHKGGAVPGEPAQKMMQWQGAVYDFKSSNKGHWTVAFQTFPQQPITRGMKPFKLNDGYCVGLNFIPEMKGVTPLLYAPKAKGNLPSIAESSTDSKDITAWTYERPDGGRAFCFTGLHSHRYMAEESIRKLVINGILWAAKIEIPADGAKAELDPADLEKNIEVPQAKDKKK